LEQSPKGRAQVALAALVASVAREPVGPAGRRATQGTVGLDQQAVEQPTAATAREAVLAALLRATLQARPPEEQEAALD
jgi:hypothetical protein